MRERAYSIRSPSGAASSEWYDVGYLRPDRSRRRLLWPLVLVFWIAIFDFTLPRTNLSILYLAPLIQASRRGRWSHLWRVSILLVALTFGVYLLKNAFHPSERTTSIFDYRMVNRCLAAVAILSMSRILHLWNRWRAEQDDPELPASVRYQDRQVGETVALLCAAPLVVLIAIVDYFAPANINLPILYPIPLFICGWTGSRRLLWFMFGLLLVWTAVAFLWGGPSIAHADHHASLVRNRILAGICMAVVTVILHFWMGDVRDDCPPNPSGDNGAA